jgi:hypothetical protein
MADSVYFAAPVSKPAVSPTPKSAKHSKLQGTLTVVTRADLEIRDTADLEVGGTSLRLRD